MLDANRPGQKLHWQSNPLHQPVRSEFGAVSGSSQEVTNHQDIESRGNLSKLEIGNVLENGTAAQPTSTVKHPSAITSGGPTQTHLSPSRAAGSFPIRTVIEAGGMMGPPT